MRRLVAFLCSGLAATLGFANDGATDTTTTTENTSGDTTTPLCVGFSFNNGAGKNGSPNATSVTKDTTGAVKGTSEALETTEWFYVGNYYSGSVENIFPFTVEESDGTTTEKPVLTWSAKNNWYTNRGSTFLDGYLDDGNNGVSISVTGFTNQYASTDYKYDVILYFSTDSGSRAFLAPTVNGTQYTYDSDNPATAKAGSDSFGNSTGLSAGKAQYGVNALRVRGLTDDLTISLAGVYGGVGARGCLAAFQIVPYNYTSTTPLLTIGGEDKTDVAWSTAGNWSTGVAAAGTVPYVNIALEGDATLDLDTDFTITAVTVTNTVDDSTSTLTLKKSDTTKTTTLYELYALGGAAIVVADTNAYKAVSSAASSAAPLTVLPNIDSSDLPFASVAAGRTFAGGAGTESDFLTFSCNGGSITLSGETPYYLGSSYSGTKTTVTYDGATVVYGGSNSGKDALFGIGTADYVLTNATVTAQNLWLSQGDNGRPATLTLNGTSTLTVTGTINADQNTASIMFGHWNGSTTFTLNDDSQFLASSDVLVGKTGNNHTINVNGGLFSAKGIILAGNASGTNKLNIDGGTLALGATGINTYSSSLTMAVNVTGDATLRATEERFPVKEAVTVAADKTLTLDKTNTLASTTYTFSSTVSGEGTLAIKEGVNVNFGTARPAKISVANASSSKVSFALNALSPDFATIACEGLTSLDNVTIYGTDGTTEMTTSSYATLEDGVLTILPPVPVLECTAGEVAFETASKWSVGSVPTSGDIFIKTVADATTTLTIGENHSYDNVYVFGTGTLVLKGDGVLTLSGVVTFREAAQMTMEANVFSEGATVSVPSGITLTLQNLGTCKCAITGAGAVKTVGDVQFTQTSSFTGGLTVTSGTASTTTQKGFGGVDNNTTAGSVTVADGGCVDVANTKDRCYSFTITGKGVATTDASGTTTYSGAMTNTGSAIPTSAMQAKSITLAGDALITVASGHGWGLLYQGYNATTLNFAGYTLTKQGDGDFFICNVTTSSSGAIAVKEGTFSTVQRASTLSGSSIRMFGNSTLRLDQTLDGLTSLDLYPAVGGVTLTSLGNLAASTTIKLKGSYLDGNDIEAGAETVTLITGTENTITNGLIASSNIALGGRFSGITYDDNGTTLTATLCSFPTKFFHYDFNGSSVSATDSKATDSQYQLGAFTSDNAPSVVAKGRTGSSGWIKNQATPYWETATSSTSPLDSCGALTVTTVARLPFATGNPSPLWCLGTVHGQNAVIILRVVDADTVAAVAIDVGTRQASVGRELARVTGIKNLTTAFHFFALVITPETARLYVDRMDPVVAKGAGAPTTGMTNCGQFGAIFGGTDVYTQNLGTTGFYLDDFQVYDAILSDTEIQALRREFCPDPFFILVK